MYTPGQQNFLEFFSVSFKTHSKEKVLGFLELEM